MTKAATVSGGISGSRVHLLGIHVMVQIVGIISRHCPAGDGKVQFFTLRTAKALAMTALDLLLQPKVMQRVKQEFTDAKLKDEKMSNGA